MADARRALVLLGLCWWGGKLALFRRGAVWLGPLLASVQNFLLPLAAFPHARS